jgi:ElaB/YqjD/DUF883 family membrane-anchored ribosome-binding protein
LASALPIFAEAPQAASAPQARTLTSDEFGRYLKALDMLMTVRSDAEEALRTQPDKAQEAAANYQKRAQAAMESHQFTTETFNTVHWNVMQAFAQVEIQANAAAVEESLEQQRAQLAAAKQEMPEAAYAESLQRVKNTEAILNGFGGVPDANLALVRAKLTQLKETFNRGMGGAQSGYRPTAKNATPH